MPVICIRVGRWIFKPTWPWTLITLAVCCVFVALGRWQWDRGQMRHAQWQQFERETGPAIPLGSRAVDSIERFRRISVTGELDAARQILLDNRVQDGIAGYDVVTPLRLPNRRLLLVDRGWVPFTGLRSHLPEVAVTTPPVVTLSGRIDNLPVAGLAAGRAPPPTTGPWPRVTSFPTAAELDAAYGEPVERRMLLLDPGQRYGYLRHWEPPGLPPERHWGYAFQWWSFAILAVILWLYTAFR